VEVSIGSIGSSKAQRKERLGKGETDMDRKAPAPHCCVQAIEKELGAELPAAVVGHQGGRWRRGVGLPAFQKRERLGRERDIDLHGWWREEKKLGWLAWGREGDAMGFAAAPWEKETAVRVVEEEEESGG
jgi:hypothetical protein